MPSLVVQGGSIIGNEDDEDFTSVDPLTQDHHQPYRKIIFGRKCLFVLLGIVGLTTITVLVTIFLINSDIFLKLSSKDNVNDIVSSLPQCPPIDTSKLWTPRHQALVVGFGKGGGSETNHQNMEIVANTSVCKEPPRLPVCREGMVGVDLGEKVLICGGSECNQVVEPRKECWHLKTFPHSDGLTSQSWRSEEIVGLRQGRAGATAILTDEGWWVTGGLVPSPFLPLDPFSSLPPLLSWSNSKLFFC